MKKIFLLLAAVGMILTACEPANGLDEDNNGNNGNNTEQPGGGNDDAIPTDKIVIKPSTITVEAAANNYIVAVSSPCSWRATTEEDWITLETELGIDGKQQLIFAVKDYYETAERQGKIVVSNRDEGFSAELTVAQKAFAPEWTVEPEALNFAVEGGTQEVVITANFDYEYSANVDWITFKRASNGISVTAPNSMEAEERTAEITISSEKYGLSKVVNVKQGAFVPEWTVETEALNFAVEGGTQEIAITANFEYKYTANVEWITFKRTSNGISVTVPNYVEVNERTAEITISSEKYGLSKVVAVKQAAFIPEFAVEQTSSSLEFDYKGGEATISVTANFDYDITCPSWITYTKVENGVKLTISTNYLTELRTAEVKIFSEKYNLRGAVITISQAGAPYKIGDILTQNGATGIVFYVGTEGVKIMSVKETRLVWSTEYVTTGATDWNNGANNMAVIKAISRWEEKYPAFKWCADYGENWYLPAYYELREIYNQRELLNATLEANGYTKLNLSDYPRYWSSTESDGYYAVNLDFDSDYSSNYKDRRYRVRAVQAF